jgi:hypothetical protein
MASKKNAAPVQEPVAEVEDDGLTETAIVAGPEALPGMLVGPDVDYTYGEDHAAAEHKVKADELIIPMLKIVQSSSKIFKDRPDGSTIKEGDIYNSVTGQVFDGTKGLLIVPICAKACVIERKSSKDGGLFIAKLSAELTGPNADPRVVKAYKANGPDEWRGLESDTRTQFGYTVEVHVVLIDPADGTTPLGVAMIPFAGTNIFPRKAWWSGMAEAPKGTNGKGSPLYAFRTVLKTEFRPGKTGQQDSYKYLAEPYGGNWSRCRFVEKAPVHADALERCKQFHQLVDSGALGRVDYSDADDSEEAQEAAVMEEPAF